jgi:WD40 repeat protein
MTALVTCFRCGKAVLTRKENLASARPHYCTACKNSLGIDDPPEEEAPKPAAPRSLGPRIEVPAPRVLARRARPEKKRSSEDDGGSYSGMLIAAGLILAGFVLLGVMALVGFLFLLPPTQTPVARSSETSEKASAAVTTRTRDPVPVVVREKPDQAVTRGPVRNDPVVRPPVDGPAVPVFQVTLRQTIRSMGSSFWGLAYSPRGDSLAAVSGYQGTLKQVRFWQTSDYSATRTILSAQSDYFGIDYRRDGNMFGLASADNSLVCVDFQGQVSERFRFPSYVRGVTFSPDGRRLAGNCERTLAIWDVSGGNLLWSCDLEGKELARWRIPTHIAFSPDGRTLAAGHGNSSLVLHDADTGAVRATARGHDDVVLCTAFSRDGRYLVSGSVDKTIKVWDPATAQEVRTLRGHRDWVYCVAFARDGHTLASAGREGAVILWDVSTGRVLANLPPFTREATCVAFSPDGRTLASCGVDGTIQIWDLGTK